MKPHKTLDSLKSSSRDQLEQARTSTYKLFQAVRSEDLKASNRAIGYLLNIAIYSSTLLKLASAFNAMGLKKACKNYDFYPVLLDSSKGRHTMKMLKAIDMMPIGENCVFKPLNGRSLNDDLRDSIKDCHETFELIRHDLRSSSDPEFDKEVKKLPKLNRRCRRKWAQMMVVWLSSTGGINELLQILKINVSKETDRKKRRKEGTLVKNFGGVRLQVLDKNNVPVTDHSVKSGGIRYIIRKGISEKEVDALTASKFEESKTTLARTQNTEADVYNSFIDVIDKRLNSILKY